MRKTSYFVAFLAVLITFLFNALSLSRPDWLVVKNSIFDSKVAVEYGLLKRCDYVLLSGGKISYTDYKCRPFPQRVADSCEKENRTFCVLWTTAAYFAELSAGFAIVACLTIIFGVSTHSRRRRIWRAVAAFVGLHALFQIATFGLVTDMYSNALLPPFEHARPGPAYILGTLSWVFSVMVTFGVLITGMAANRGHKWAAGNRAYQPIPGN